MVPLLRAAMRHNPEVTLDVLVAACDLQGVRVGRTTIHDVLTGRSAPRFDILAVVYAEVGAEAIALAAAGLAGGVFVAGIGGSGVDLRDAALRLGGAVGSVQASLQLALEDQRLSSDERKDLLRRLEAASTAVSALRQAVVAS